MVPNVLEDRLERFGARTSTDPRGRCVCDDSVRVRAFDDGVGFRYEVPAQPALGTFAIAGELTEFALADNARAGWIPSNRPRMDRSEMLFSSGPVSLLDSVQTPLTMELTDGPGANWLDNPLPVTTHRPLSAATRLRVALAPGGGQAIRIRPVP